MEITWVVKKMFGVIRANCSKNDGPLVKNVSPASKYTRRSILSIYIAVQFEKGVSWVKSGNWKPFDHPQKWRENKKTV